MAAIYRLRPNLAKEPERFPWDEAERSPLMLRIRDLAVTTD
jgi:hypothetical protein